MDPDGARLLRDAADEVDSWAVRELKELRADIERAGLDTSPAQGAPRACAAHRRPARLGRSALAGELVRQVADRYPDGVLRARLSEPDGTRVPVGRAARELLDALEAPAPRAARTSSARRCAPRWPTAGCCSCWTTRPTPSRSTRCCGQPDCLAVVVSGVR
ncbi:hypothetical protein GCM10023238_03020 [Streptomyces heliomycini]